MILNDRDIKNFGMKRDIEPTNLVKTPLVFGVLVNCVHRRKSSNSRWDGFQVTGKTDLGGQRLGRSENKSLDFGLNPRIPEPFCKDPSEQLNLYM